MKLFFYQWNQLPDEIIRCNTLNSFKFAIDNYFNENKYIFLILFDLIMYQSGLQVVPLPVFQS